MRLSAISIDGVGLFSGCFTCQLPGEIALILGDNETGKSTLVATIGAILFGFAKKAEKALFSPVPGGDPRSGSLEVETDEGIYRISREFGKNRTKIELLTQEGKILFDGIASPSGYGDEKERYNRLLNNIFGIENPDLFYNSIFMEQGKLLPKLDEVVLRIVSGGSSSDYAIVLETLKKNCEKLTVELPWGKAAAKKPKQIEQLHQLIIEKKRALEENHSAAAQIGQLQQRLKELEEKVNISEQGIADAADWSKKLSDFSVALNRKKEVEDQLKRCRKQKDEIYHLEKIRGELTSKIRTDFPEYMQLPPEAEKELSETAGLSRSIQDLQERQRTAEQSAPHFKLPRFAPVVVGAGIAFSAVGAIFLNGLPAIMLVIAGIAVACFPFVSGIVQLQSERSAHRGKLLEIGDQLRSLKQQLKDRKEKYCLLVSHEVDEVLHGLRALKELRSEIEKKAEALKQHPPPDEAENRFNELSNSLLEVNHRLNVLKEEHPRLTDIERENTVGHHLEKTKQDLESGQRHLKTLKKEHDEVKYKLAGIEAQEVLSEEALEAELEEMRAQAERLKLYRDAYLTAIPVLEEAISEFRSSHLTRIEEKTGEHLTAITGKECKVRLGKHLEPLHVEQGEQKFFPEQLSQGTKDQLHFSLRLAAIGEISGNNKLPIILDDPFVNFDADRLTAAQEMLARLAKSHQIILLTHDRRYAEWKKPVVVL